MRAADTGKVASFVGALLMLSAVAARSAEASSPPAQAPVQALDFGVFWPPRDPSLPPPNDAPPLLDGSLVVRLEAGAGVQPIIRLHLTLTRRADEAARERWNSRLAFPEYDWMRYLRVWDADQRWLWPNVPYLLRVHGTERIDRYGGTDPGKGVDNDFAAVLIRKFDADGTQESEDSRRAPLVSAEWHPVGVEKVDRQTIVHGAQSDEFGVHLGQGGTVRPGQVSIWLIYADFMGAKVPESWPKAPEWAGGILSYFEVRWTVDAGGQYAVHLRRMVPPRGTGFAWEGWRTRTRAAKDPNRTAKLSDLPAIGPPAVERRP